MRILVTGGAGFIGSAPVADHAGYSFVRGDICDPDVVDQVMAGQDAVVHFAAESHVD